MKQLLISIKTRTGHIIDELQEFRFPEECLANSTKVIIGVTVPGNTMVIVVDGDGKH